MYVQQDSTSTVLSPWGVVFAIDASAKFLSARAKNIFGVQRKNLK
jgi:hypothetical protein